VTDVFLPECSLPVGETGLPCKRWPGHIGPCIDIEGHMDYKPFVIPQSMELDESPEIPDFERVILGIVVWGVVWTVLTLVSLGIGIYLLVR
jgi:hypothetical protein